MSGASMPCSSMFIEPIRSMVESKSYPWNIERWKCRRCVASVSAPGWCSRTYSLAATRKPAVPQAGSQISSPGCGSIIATMSSMMWRGVRNWPLTPALAILDSRYS